jgi:hypothetical protein
MLRKDVKYNLPRYFVGPSSYILSLKSSIVVGIELFCVLNLDSVVLLLAVVLIRSAAASLFLDR